MPFRKQNEDVWIAVVVLGFAALAAYVIWQFSEFIGLDVDTSARVLARSILLVCIEGVYWWQGYDYPLLKLKNIWPIYVTCYWVCWWPALDFFEASSSSDTLRTMNAWAVAAMPDGYRENTASELVIRFVGFFGLLVLGYVIEFARRTFLKRNTGMSVR